MNDNAKAWVVALRSDEFKQAGKRLASSEGHCCLGVACELAYRAGVVKERKVLPPSEGDMVAYDGDTHILPHTVRDWLGLCSATPGFWAPEGAGKTAADGNPWNVTDDGRQYVGLARLNDSEKLDFKAIATIIESEPKGLFGAPTDLTMCGK